MRMKRKLLCVDMALATLATVFSVASYVYTRGIDIYVISTNAGSFLVIAWQIAALAALVLWLPAIIAGLRRLSRVKSAGAVPHVGAKTPSETGMSVKLRKSNHEKSAEKTGTLIKPRGPVADPEKTERIAEDTGDVTSGVFGTVETSAEAPTELLNDSSDAATELVDGHSNEPPAPPAAMSAQPVNGPVMPNAVPAVPVRDSTPVEKEAPPAPVRSGGRMFCSMCGTEVTGKKFCPQCGKKVEV